MANKAYVYAIYPNKEQAELCQKTFGCCRFVYNQMLSVQQERYKNGEKHLSKLAENNYCTQYLKKDFLFLKEVDKFALTNAIFHLADGFDRFFKKQGGYLVKVDKWFPSSQLCHWCGYRSENLKDLKIRKWDCPHCGHKGIDRDWNAAINIKTEGLRILESE